MNPHAEALKRRTFAFGLRVVRFCRSIRTTWEGRGFSDQLFRAACRGCSHADFTAKPGLVVEEADECLYWLEMIEAADVCRATELDALPQEARELWAIFNQSQLTARQSAGRRRRREYCKSVDS